MFGSYSYHEIIRKTIISFGTLFNTITIKHKKQNGEIHSVMEVPIAYGPVEKFLARLEQKPDLRNRVAIVLPRMSFEMTSIQYDSSRKVSTMQTFNAVNVSGEKSARKVFMPVPYNIGFRLSIMAQYNEDAIQIVEQILPFFQPSFNLTVDLVESIGEKRDIPMVLNSVSFEDNYDSGYEEKRVVIYNLDFIAKTYLFGPIDNSTSGLIKKVQVDYYTNTNTKNASRQLRYKVEPRAIQDYNNDETTFITSDISTEKTQFEVNDTSTLVLNSYIQINDEVMFIKGIEGNVLLVNRAQEDSLIDNHINGSKVNVINSTDDALVEVGDDFGFSEYRYDFGDGKIYSPTKGVDV
jgi:hypothetical protein